MSAICSVCGDEPYADGTCPSCRIMELEEGLRLTWSKEETMTFDEYQEISTRTADMGEDTDKLAAIFALGVAGEAGEIADLIKKWIGHGHDQNKEKLKEEMGDLLWYISQLARCYGLNFSEIAQFNIDKLAKRYPDGFSHEASRNRKA